MHMYENYNCARSHLFLLKYVKNTRKNNCIQLFDFARDNLNRNQWGWIVRRLSRLLRLKVSITNNLSPLVCVIKETSLQETDFRLQLRREKLWQISKVDARKWRVFHAIFYQRIRYVKKKHTHKSTLFFKLIAI